MGIGRIAVAPALVKFVGRHSEVSHFAIVRSERERAPVLGQYEQIAATRTAHKGPCQKHCPWRTAPKQSEVEHFAVRSAQAQARVMTESGFAKAVGLPWPEGWWIIPTRSRPAAAVASLAVPRIEAQVAGVTVGSTVDSQLLPG